MSYFHISTSPTTSNIFLSMTHILDLLLIITEENCLSVIIVLSNWWQWWLWWYEVRNESAGNVFLWKFPMNKSRSKLRDSGSPTPKIEKKREKKRNECISQKIAGMSRSLQKAWILGHHTVGTPTSWPGKPAKVAEKQEEEKRYNRGRWRGCKLLSTICPLSLLFLSPSPPPHLSFSRRRGSNVDFWALGRLILPSPDTVNT